MAEMVTVGGVRYRKDDADRLKLTPDTKAYAKKIAENDVPVGTSEADYKAATKAAPRKAAGGDAGTTSGTGVVSTATANTPGADGTGDNGGAGADGAK